MFKCFISLLLVVASPVLADDNVQGSKNPSETPSAVVPAAANQTEAASPASATQITGYACTMAKLKRSVTVDYEKQDAKVPCKVNYVRDVDSGEAKVLFSATAEEGFCEKKASEFVEKLKSGGWTCTNQ
jgi:endonuclease YncB( thermonuclease family)